MKVVSVMQERTQLKQEYSAKQTELQTYTDQMVMLNTKIERIEHLKAEFIEHRDELIALEKRLQSLSKEDYDYWIGERLDKYQTLLESELINDRLRHYINRVEQNIDELNRESIRLKNEMYNTEGLIGNVKSTLTSLTTKIENFIF